MADQDILIGPGKLYYAPVSTANPDETTTVYGAAWSGGWTDLGDFIEGSGITLSISEEFTKVYTEQETAPKNAVRTRREMMVRGTLAEHSITNMALILQGTAEPTSAGPAQKGYSEIPFGTESDVDFYKFGIEALRKDTTDSNQPVRWFLHKGYIRLNGDVAYTKQNPTGVPIEITILGDGSQSAGEELGILQIVTAPATTTA